MSEDKPRPTGAGDLDEPSDSRDEAQSSVVAELPQFRSERLLVGSFVYGWIWPAAAKEWVRNSVITSAAVTLTLTIMLTHLPERYAGTFAAPALFLERRFAGRVNNCNVGSLIWHLVTEYHIPPAL